MVPAGLERQIGGSSHRRYARQLFQLSHQFTIEIADFLYLLVLSFGQAQ